MIKFCKALGWFLFFTVTVFAQSPSFDTYLNPVIPGDHPDPTLTKIGSYFYTSGSSFNPTPKIYRSTDLVHWEVIAQPVSPSWSVYGDAPGGGIWGGHMVLYHDVYWHFFGRGGGNMYFVTADQPEGPWSEPTRMNVPTGLTGLGVDNSIFIDEETDRWYLLTKNGQANNHIVELGEDGQPDGDIFDLTWLNPDEEGNPYGWAEGPVMWQYNGYYFYSFAQHLVGEQYVMRSETLTDDESAWTIFSGNIFYGSRSTYNRPNHISPAVMLDDSTSWVIVHSYHTNSSWYAHGRQGLLCQVTYNEDGFPIIEFPPGQPVDAPKLPSNGTPWAVARSDMFNTATISPVWSFLGFTPDNTYSLTDREGWLHLSPYQGENTVIQNDGEHCYSLVTHVDFEPASASDQAGLWIINGPETHYAKVFGSMNQDGKAIFGFSFEDTVFEAENTIGSVAWLKLARYEHEVSGFYSADGISWTQIGEAIDATDMDISQTDYNNFTGNQQGLFIEGKDAYFDCYIYKDAYTPIFADSPANQVGTTRRSTDLGYALDNIHIDDWTMYAGVDFGNTDYNKVPAVIKLTASCATTGSYVEVWLDSMDTGTKIADCAIENTGSTKTFKTFVTPVEPVTGQHDLYLKFKGTDSGKLFQFHSFYFALEGDTGTSAVKPSDAVMPGSFGLEQNYPNPFNPTTLIRFKVPDKSFVSLKVYNVMGEELQQLAGKEYLAGEYSVKFDATQLASGIYFYTLKAKDFLQTKKMFVIK